VTETARLVTRYSLEAGLFQQDRITSLDKARLYRKALENRAPVVWHAKAYRRTPHGMREFVPALLSVAGLSPEYITNGLALNLKFTPDDGDPAAMLENFVAFVKGYFDAGGMEIQFNVTSHADFIAAVQDPSRYSELLVRVSGYTAYFKDLSPMMQQEIIDRTEYRLSTGAAVAYGPFALSKGVSDGCC
jgi:hypothetical protein